MGNKLCTEAYLLIFFIFNATTDRHPKKDCLSVVVLYTFSLSVGKSRGERSGTLLM